jgi:hypothetical protein
MPAGPDEAAIIQYFAAELDGVDVVEASGNRFFFYDPGGGLPVDRRFPFATLVTSDEYDQDSNLSREGVFRLNIGVSRETCRALFGDATREDDDAEPHYDFTALDAIMPHPVYGTMHWVCVLNPSAETFERVKPLLAEAHAQAARRQAGRRQTDIQQADTQEDETW